jgi:hypothetical protein
MPLLLNSIEINNYFNEGLITGSTSAEATGLALLTPMGKSIAKTYRFFITIFPSIKAITNQTQRDLYKRIGAMPIIRAFHAISVSIPWYSYDRQKQQYGPLPRSFTELKGDGLEVQFVLEEDDKFTISNFISWCQRAVIEPKRGLYTPPDATKISLIGVVCENDMGIGVAAFTLHDAFFLNSSALDLSYEENRSIRYTVTFGVDVINTFFPISSTFNKLTSLIMM